MDLADLSTIVGTPLELNRFGSNVRITVQAMVNIWSCTNPENPIGIVSLIYDGREKGFLVFGKPNGFSLKTVIENWDMIVKNVTKLTNNNYVIGEETPELYKSTPTCIIPVRIMKNDGNFETYSIDLAAKNLNILE